MGLRTIQADVAPSYLGQVWRKTVFVLLATLLANVALAVGTGTIEILVGSR